MKHRFAAPTADRNQLEPYGAPVILLSADPALLELVDLAFADHAPLGWTSSEQQLLDLLLAEPVAAIVLDGALAEPADICLRLRLASQAPLVVVARGGDADSRVRLLRAGADDVLARPCWPEELRVRVAARLRRVAWETAAPEAAPALRVQLRLLRALERAPGRFVPAAALCHTFGDDELAPAAVDDYLGDLAVRLNRLGLAQLERGAGAAYRLVWGAGAHAA